MRVFVKRAYYMKWVTRMRSRMNDVRDFSDCRRYYSTSFPKMVLRRTWLTYTLHDTISNSSALDSMDNNKNINHCSGGSGAFSERRCGGPGERVVGDGVYTRASCEAYCGANKKNLRNNNNKQFLIFVFISSATTAGRRAIK